MNLEDFAAENYPELQGLYVPAGVLLAWLFREHEHLEEDEAAVVRSGPLEAFIREEASCLPVPLPPGTP